jgi:hypothetical protein
MSRKVGTQPVLCGAASASNGKLEDARRRLENWVTQMRLSLVSWEIVDDETLIGRILGHFVVVPSLLLPKGNYTRVFR